MGLVGGCDQKKYTTPGLRELAWWERNAFIEHPDRLVKKAAMLLRSERWEEEMVLDS